MWSLGFVGNLLRARSIYDAARNRGHLALCNWEMLRLLSAELVESKLSKRVSQEARDRLDWHREQGHVRALQQPLSRRLGLGRNHRG